MEKTIIAIIAKILNILFQWNLFLKMNLKVVVRII